jgi:RNA polymerase sigma-70 factor (ECF subfamily)
LCIDRIRKRAPVLNDPPEPFQSVEEPVLQEEKHRAVRRALEFLPVNLRAAVLLKETEDLSYLEIAGTLNATVSQVTNWIYRGKAELRKRLLPYLEKGEMP